MKKLIIFFTVLNVFIILFLSTGCEDNKKNIILNSNPENLKKVLVNTTRWNLDNSYAELGWQEGEIIEENKYFFKVRLNPNLPGSSFAKECWIYKNSTNIVEID